MTKQTYPAADEPYKPQPSEGEDDSTEEEEEEVLPLARQGAAASRSESRNHNPYAMTVAGGRYTHDYGGYHQPTVRRGYHD